MFVKLKNITPFKLCVIQEFPFIEADFDAVTSYQLLCKVVEYLNKVIAAENAQNDNINELKEAVNALTDYVNEIGEKVDDFDEEFTTKTLKAISLILSGNATIGGNLTVDGEFSLNDKATIDADVDIKQDLMVDGFTNLKSAELEGDLIVGGDLSINGKEAATVDMIPDISGKLDKTGGTINGNLAVTGALTKGGVAVATVEDIPEPVDISGKYDKTGGTITGDVTIKGKLGVGNSLVEPNIIGTPVLEVTNYFETPRILNPNGGKFGKPITVDATLNITNGVILGGDSTMNGVKIATVDDIPTVTGDMSYKGTVGTGGTITDLPTPSEANKGDVYKVVEDGEYSSVPTSQKTKGYKGDLFIGNVSEWVHVPSGTAGTIEHDLMIDGNLTVAGIITADEINGVNSFSAKNGSFTDSLSVADLDVSGSTVINADVTVNSDLLLTGDLDMSRGSGDIIIAKGRNIISGDTNYIGVCDDDTDNIVIKSQEDNIEVLAYHDILIKAVDNVNITSTEQSVNINSGDTLNIKTSAVGNITTNDNLNMTSSEDEVHINGANGIFIRQTNDDNSSQVFLDSDGWFGAEAKTRADIKVKVDDTTTHTMTIDDEGLTFNGNEVATIKTYDNFNIEFDAQSGNISNLPTGLNFLKQLFEIIKNNKQITMDIEIDYNGDGGKVNLSIVGGENAVSGFVLQYNGAMTEYYVCLTKTPNYLEFYIFDKSNDKELYTTYYYANNTYVHEGWNWSNDNYYNYIKINKIVAIK